MKYGVVYFPTDYSIRVDDMARAVEDRGYESLWLPEHTHIPTSRRSPYPLGAELPREYIDGYELMTGMAFAAAATRKIIIGSSICLVVSAIRSSWPRNWRRSTGFQVDGSSLVSVPDGTPRRWKITVSSGRIGAR